MGYMLFYYILYLVLKFPTVLNPGQFRILNPKPIVQINQSRLDEKQIQNVNDIHDVIEHEPCDQIATGLIGESDSEWNDETVVQIAQGH
jgi:hypothetical protein